MFEEFKTATEQELRDMKTPWPKTIEELNEFISVMTERAHDYGTCVYAMSMVAEASFNYVASKLGVTGFQVGCADLDFLQRIRNMDCGFMILNYNDLMYTQYLNEEHFPTYQTLIENNKKVLANKARENLKNTPGAHQDVIAHWEYLASLHDGSEDEDS